jgi:hypothetical protein
MRFSGLGCCLPATYLTGRRRPDRSPLDPFRVYSQYAGLTIGLKNNDMANMGERQLTEQNPILDLRCYRADRKTAAPDGPPLV